MARSHNSSEASQEDPMRVVAQYLAAVAAILVMSAVTTAANPPEGVCRATPIPGVQDYVVDARENNRGAGRTRYRQKEQVRMVLVNRNPYLYEYRVSIEATPVSGPSPADFLALFGISFSPAAAGTEPDGAKETALPSREAPATLSTSSCSVAVALKDAEKSVVTARRKVMDVWTPVKNSVTRATAALETANQTFKDPVVACEALYGASTTFVDALEEFKLTPKPVQDSLDQLRRRVADLDDLVSRAENELPSCATDAKHYRTAATLAKADADKLAADFEAAVKAAKELGAARTTVQAVLKNPESFTQTEWVPDSLEPTDVTIVVSRRELTPDAPFASVFEKRLNFGGRALFAVSGGWATAWLRKVEYAAVDGAPLGPDNAPIGDPAQIVPVVGTTENSRARSGPVVLGHVRLYEFREGLAALHATLGVSPQSVGASTQLEVFVGPSVSFANELAFLTAGAYRGFQRRLEGSYYLGKPLPAGTTTIPTALDEHWRFGVSFSFRVK